MIGLALFPSLLKYKVSPQWDLFTDAFGVTVYKSFLKIHNPHLIAKSETGLTKAVPDILIHNNNIKEFYEIKPNSIAGRSAGKEKITKLLSIYKDFNLPYIEGEKFIPPDELKLGTINIVISGAKVPVHVSIGLKKHGALIYYSLCIETDIEKVYLTKAEKQLLEAIFKMIRKFFQEALETIKTMKLFGHALIVLFEIWLQSYLDELKKISGTEASAAILFILFLATAEFTVPLALLEAAEVYLSAALKSVL